MNKNSKFLSFWAGLLMITLFNGLQAKNQGSPNPYSWTSFQDMKDFASTDMDKGNQEKIRQVLRAMGIRNFEKISLKKLSKNPSREGIVTSTGIWINPDLPESRVDYVQYREAKKYWEKNKVNEINGYDRFGLSFLTMVAASGSLESNFSKVVFLTAGLSAVKNAWKIDNYRYKIKKQQLKALRCRGYEDLAVDLEKGRWWWQ